MDFKRDGITYYDEFAEYASQIAPHEWDYFDLADGLSDQIFTLMKDKGIKKSDLAKRLGHSRAYVTKVLAGDMNITLKTLAKILYHLDAKAHVKIIDSKQDGMWLPIKMPHSPNTWETVPGDVSLRSQQDSDTVPLLAMAA